MSLSAEDLRLLHRLQKTRAKARRKAMLETPRLKQLLRAVAYNVLKGNVPMSRNQHRKLTRFKKNRRPPVVVFRYYVQKALSPSSKRRLFAGSALPPVRQRFGRPDR